MPADFSQITRLGNLSGEVAARIKESILSGQYGPGDALPSENQLTGQFGVSRVVIREALMELKTKGLIEVRRGPKGGPFVTQLDMLTFGEQFSDMIRLGRMTVGQLFQVRLLIEPEIICIVIRDITDEQIQSLGKLVEQTNRETDPLRRKDFNQEFHRRLGQLSGNPFYGFLMDSFMDFVDRFIMVINPCTYDAHDDMIHGEIVEAIAKRDESRAVALVREHLLDSREKLMTQEEAYLGAI